MIANKCQLRIAEKRYPTTVFGLCLACASMVMCLMLAGCREVDLPPEPVRPVRTVKVGDLKAIVGREFPGRASAKQAVDLAFRVSGPLISLNVDVGSKVSKSDVIAQIDPRDFQAFVDTAQGNLDRDRANLLAMERGARPEEIEQLKAALAQAVASERQAAAELRRLERLLEQNAVPQSDFDIAKARAERTAAEVKQAEEDLNIGQSGARLEDLEAKRSEIRALEGALATAMNQLEYTTLTAPFDGEVAARYVDNFQTVQAKEPIVRLLDITRIEVTVQIPEILIGIIPQVQQVACRFDAFPDREFTGKVTKIGGEASETTRTYPVTIEIDPPDDARILPGMAAMVRNQPVEGDDAANKMLTIPPSAVFTTADGPESYVWVVDANSNKVSRRLIKIGELTPVGLSVAEGLAVGDIVVTTGVNSLRDGQEVKLL